MNIGRTSTQSKVASAMGLSSPALWGQRQFLVRPQPAPCNPLHSLPVYSTTAPRRNGRSRPRTRVRAQARVPSRGCDVDRAHGDEHHIMMNDVISRPFYTEYAWAFDLLIDRPVRNECAVIVADRARRSARREDS